MMNNLTPEQLAFRAGYEQGRFDAQVEAAQQEPVAWLVESKHGNWAPYLEWSEPSYLETQVVTPLYTSPPANANAGKSLVGHEMSRETRDKISKSLKEYNHEKTSECESNSRS